MPDLNTIPKDTLEHFRSMGYSDAEIAANIQPPKQISTQPIGTGATVGRTLKAHAGGILGGGAGMIGASALGYALAPETFGASLLLPIGVGIAGAMGGSYAGQKLQEGVESPETYAAQQQAAEEAAAQNPKTALATDIIGSAVASGGKPSLDALRAGQSLIGKLGGKAITEEGKNALVGTIMNAGINPAINTGIGLATGQGMPSGQDLAAQVAGGALFSRQAKWAGRLIGHTEPAPEVINNDGQTSQTKEKPSVEMTTPYTKVDENGEYTIGNTALKSMFMKNFAEKVKGIEDPVAKAEAQTRNEMLRNLSPDDMRQQLHVAAMAEKAKSIVGANDLDAGLHNAEDTTDVNLPWQEPSPEVTNATKVTPKDTSNESTGLSTSQASPAPVSANAQDFLKAKIEDLQQNGIGSSVTTPPVLPKVNPVVEEAKARGRDERQDNTQPKSQAELVAEQFEQKGNVNAPPSDPTKPKYIGLQKGAGNIPDTDYYNLQRPIVDGNGKVIHGAGSTVSEHTLRKYGVDFDEKGIPKPKINGDGKIGIPLMLQNHIRQNKATTGSILHSLANTSDHPFQPLAKALLNAADTKSLNVKWNHRPELDQSGGVSERSHYHPTDDVVNIGTGSSADARVVMEEAIHSLTSKKIPYFSGQGVDHYNELQAYLKDGKNEHVKSLIQAYFDTAKALGIERKLFRDTPDVVGSLAGEPIKGLAGNAEEAVKKLQGVGHSTRYAMGNLDEFLAQAIKDPEFQKVLESIPSGENRSVWQNIVDAVKNLLGLNGKTGSMLESVLRTGGELVAQNRDGSEGTRSASLPKQERSNKFLINGAELVKDPTKLGLRPNTSGAYNGTQLLGTLMNKLSPMEQDIYRKEGIEQYFSGRTISQADAVKWMEEHSPKAETHTYGMEGKVSEAKKEYDKMTHEWYDVMPMRTKVALEHGELTGDAELTAKYEKYKQLEQQVKSEPRDISPRATSHYSSVSALPTDEPMPDWTATKSGKNVQRVDVVIPKKPYSLETFNSKGQYPHEEELWQPDNLHENLPNTLGWAMIQYKTGPKGEKMAVIAEAQSRWGQSRREATQLLKSKETALREKEIVQLHKGTLNRDSGLTNVVLGQDRQTVVKVPDEIAAKLQVGGKMSDEAIQVAMKHYEEIGTRVKDAPDHPLLRDYNRLILKAAIDQARKEGATHIMVSDGETAMMTEGHDAHGLRLLPTENNIHLLEQEGETSAANKLRKGETTDTGRGDVKELIDEGYDLAPEQDKGMRLNYDNILQKIAEELTGSKGEKVSIGEHKNAMELKMNYPQGNAPADAPKIPRSNLIFRNADGTPKTDVSGRLYPIHEVPDREPMLYGKRYAMPKPPEGQSHTPEELSLPKDKYMGKLGAAFRSVIDKVRDIPKAHANLLADAATQAVNKETELRGRWKNAIVQSGENLNKVQKDRIMAAFNHEMATKTSGMGLLRSTAERQFYSKARQLLNDSGKYRLAIGEPVTEAKSVNGKTIYTKRNLKQDEFYFPGMANQKIQQIYRNNTDHAAIESLDKEFHNYNTKTLGLSESSSQERIDNYKKALQGSIKNSDVSHQDYFNAHRKAQGTPLPPSFREHDPVRNLERYFDRAAIDASHYEFMEKNHKVLAALGQEKDAWNNKVVPEKGVSSLSNNPAVKALLEHWKGEPVSPAEGNESSLSSLISSAFISGPALELHKTVSNIVKTLSLSSNPVVLARAITHAMTGVTSGYQHAVENGVVKLTARSVTQLLDGSSTAAERMQSLSRIIRKVSTLNDLTTKVSTGLVQSMNEVIIPSKIARGAAGDVTSQKFLKNLDPTYNPHKVYSQEEIQQLASRSANYIHGTGDIRSMPAWMLNDSEFSGFFSLAHWSIAQTNNFMKDVYEPARRGDIRPLLTGMFGAAIGGYLIKELRQDIQGKKSPIPSLTEIAASDRGIEGNHGLVAYNMIAAMQFAGFGGLLSQLAKYPFDAAYKNNPQGATFPMDEVASDLAKTLHEVSTTIANDPNVNWVDLVKAVSMHTLSTNFQLSRIAINQGINNGFITGLPAEKKMLSDKMGQLRRFDMVEGLPYNEIDEASNPYMNLEQKKFKMEQDLPTAMKSLPQLVQNIMDTYHDRPDVMMGKLKSLKENNYSTFPSMEQMPLSFYKYIGYLNRTEGPEKAQEELQDYMKHKIVNEVKSSIVP